MSHKVDTGDVVLVPHVSKEAREKGETKANVYRFQLRQGFRAKISFLNREELLWLVDHAADVREILKQTQEQVYNAEDRKLRAEAAKAVAADEKRKQAFAQAAAEQAGMAGLVAKMVMEQLKAAGAIKA